MRVILLKQLQNVGKVLDEVTVKSGYARNYLFPKGIAVQATAANLEHYRAKKDQLNKEAEAVLAASKAKAEKLEGMVVTLVENASEEGKLFGSVSTKEIAEAVTNQGIELEKREVSLPQAIRAVGEYDIALHLHSEVTVNIKLTVTAKEAE